MNPSRNRIVNPKIVKVVAAIVVGLSVGTLIPPEPVTLPVVGPASGIAVGGIGLVLGAVLYLWIPKRVSGSGSGCGCSGDCDC